MYKTKYWLLALLLLLPLQARAADIQDPCTALPSTSVAINFTTTGANTTSLVGVVTGQAVYVCSFSVSIPTSAGAAASLQFEYGTGAACSSPTVLTGTLGSGFIGAGAPILYSYGDGAGTIFTAAPNNGLCMVTAGTNVNIQGFVTYVQN